MPTAKPGPTAAEGCRDLTPEQQDWVRHSDALWREAHRIAAAHPEHDPSDLYHALRALERTPTERLRVGLQRGRLRDPLERVIVSKRATQRPKDLAALPALEATAAARTERDEDGRRG